MNKRILSVVMVVLIMAGSIPVVFWVLDKPRVDEYERTTLEISILVEVKNLGNSPATDIPLRLAVPMNGLDHQEVISIDFSVAPERRSNDTLGNSFIHYTIDEIAPGRSFNLTVTTKLMMTSIDREVFGEGGTLESGEEESLSRYLLDSSLIVVNDPTIIEVARDIAGRSDDITEIAWNTYEWVLDNIYYQQVPYEWDSVTTLRNGEGGSAEMSNLYVALLRANGIPARRISGWGNVFEKGEELALTRFAHGWAEFHIPDMGWIQVDPAWGKTSKFDSFARTDANHIILTKGAGVKFLWRGPYTSPYGETEVDTDYSLVVGGKEVENLSLRRDVIEGAILSIPAFFVVFILVRWLKRRKV